MPVHRRGFTLIELLVVVAIVAVLAVVVILTLNPAELLRQARDTNRLSDMANLNSAVALFQTDNPSGSLGTASTTYLSLVDPAATSTSGTNCAGIAGLPAMPAIYSYHCAASSTLRLTNGSTGWLPVNLNSISSGSPLGLLPIDPTNTSSSRLFYSYAPQGTQFELSSSMEASKDKLGGANDKVSTDGGNQPSLYETGSNTKLQPLDYGDSSLIGYWTFDEGGGTTAYDYSGTNATGTWNGAQVGTSGYYSAGKVGSFAGTYNGMSTTTTYLDVPRSAAIEPTAVTVSAWIRTTSTNAVAVDKSFVAGTSDSYQIYVNPSGIFRWGIYNGSFITFTGTTNVSDGAWHLLTGTYDGSTLRSYVDGSAQPGTASTSGNVTYNATKDLFMGFNSPSGGGFYFPGTIDDVRLYNRSLSAAEVAALYNSTR